LDDNQNKNFVNLKKIVIKKYKEEKLTNQYKLTSTALKSSIKENKTSYYNIQIATYEDRIKTAWNFAKSLTGRSNTPDVINDINTGESLFSDWATISQYFNKYFLSTVDTINTVNNK
jgi:hypothetical protein